MNNKPLFVGLGVFFWFLALVFIRIAGPTLFVNGNPVLFVLFAVSVPVAWALIKFSAAVGKVQGRALFSAVAIMCLTALMLDGVAITWLPSAYGLPATSLVLAAAWLLWGIGVSLLVAFLLTGGVNE